MHYILLSIKGKLSLPMVEKEKDQKNVDNQDNPTVVCPRDQPNWAIQLQGNFYYKAGQAPYWETLCSYFFGVLQLV